VSDRNSDILRVAVPVLIGAILAFGFTSIGFSLYGIFIMIRFPLPKNRTIIKHGEVKIFYDKRNGGDWKSALKSFMDKNGITDARVNAAGTVFLKYGEELLEVVFE